MGRVLLSIFLLIATIVGIARAKEDYPIKNSSCDGCILVVVIGHGVAEGHAGRYYLPSGYTVQRFWKERPVALTYPSAQFTVTRRTEDGKDTRFSIDVRSVDSRAFVLREGDVLFVSQPII